MKVLHRTPLRCTSIATASISGATLLFLDLLQEDCRDLEVLDLLTMSQQL